MAEKTSQNTDFLRFSAYSFKDLLTRKLSENTKFTDQVYEGSNLAILIDLCAYLFQGLTYCINSAASESMFSDTQIYKNISRLVKLIGYNPKGFIPSSCTFQFNTDGNFDNINIPVYTAIDTNRFDSFGKKIYYSFANPDDTKIQLAKGTSGALAYNGRWKMYNEIFTSSGTKYETFTLTNVESNSAKGKFAAHGFIDVYVQRKDTGEFYKFKGLTDEIFVNTSSKYDSSSDIDSMSIIGNGENDRYFSIRLNENKQYEIKFGNDANGQTLNVGDRIYVLYLESNGFDAELQIGDVKDASFKEPAALMGIDDALFYQGFLGMTDDDIAQTKAAIESVSAVTNIEASTVAHAEEDVEDIRQTAPDYYKLGNRLITKADFEYYVKNRYKGEIIDVKCQNNWDYISTFYGWLYKLGKIGARTEYETSKNIKRLSDPRYYINQSRLSRYAYADPADENNVYLWIKMQNLSDAWKTQIDNDLVSIKVLTAEVVFVDPIDVNFAICAAPVQRALEYLDTSTVFDDNNESYIEITISDNALYSNTAIKMQVNAIFVNYFSDAKMSLGQVVNVNEIVSKIYDINGVQRVRTVFSSSEVDKNGNKRWLDRFVDGVSFATWSADVIDAGDDMTISTINRTLEDFQFPKMYNLSITNKIKVIKKSFSNNSMVQY